jgi:tetratricopeptide (TPR) repeat protein
MAQARKRRAAAIPAPLKNALSLHRAGRLGEAERAYRATLAAHPSHPQALHGLGTLYYQLGRLAAARDCLAEAVSRKAGLHGAWYELGNVRRDLGDLAGAITAYRRALQHAPDFAPAHCALARLRDGSDPAAEAAEAKALRQVHARSKAGSLERRDLAWGLAAIAERAGDVEATLTHLAEAHGVDAARQPFDVAGASRYFDALAGALDAEAIAARAADGGSGSELPVFVFGLPRSGTTLVEQVLDSHSAVHGAGELRLIGDLCGDLERRARQPFNVAFGRLSAADRRGIAGTYLKALQSRAPLAKRVVDKMPANFLALPLLACLFPKARFIHCRRDALATCWSLYRTRFDEPHRYANDPAQLGAYWRLYDDYMKRMAGLLGDRLYSVSYEELVASPEPVINALLAHCGLEPEAACLAPEQNPRPVTTASTLQVRRPIHGGAIEGHRPFTAALPALREALEGAA